MRARGALIAAALTTAVALVATGCGEESPPPAAEPAVSPPPSVPPAGRILRLGGELEGVTADARTGLAAVIVRRERESALALVDIDRWRVERRVALPSGGRHLDLARSGGPVLVPSEGSDELVTVALPSGSTRAIAVGDLPHDAAATDRRIFVGNEFDDTISVIDARMVGETLVAPEQPGGLAAANDVLAVVAVAERVLATYSASTLEPLGRVGAGEGPTHLVTAGRRAFVVDTEGEAVLGFDLAAEPRLVSTTPAPGVPYGIAIDSRRARVWLTLTARNEAVAYAITMDGLRRLRRYPTVRQPNTIAVDPRSGDALVAGRSAGGPLQRIPGP